MEKIVLFRRYPTMKITFKNNEHIANGTPRIMMMYSMQGMCC